MRPTCFPIFIHGPGSFYFNSRGQATGGFYWAGTSLVTIWDGPLDSSTFQDVRRGFFHCLNEDQLDYIHFISLYLVPVLENQEKKRMKLVWYDLFTIKSNFLHFANIKWCYLWKPENILSISYIKMMSLSSVLTSLFWFYRKALTYSLLTF